jgi:hypothetical protein
MENYRDVSGPPNWSDGENSSAFADAERHLGHVLREANGWAAWDATHPAESGDGFRFVGLYESLQDAKFAVESSVAMLGPARGKKYLVV